MAMKSSSVCALESEKITKTKWAQYYGTPRTSNLTLFQLYTHPISHSSNLTFFQSHILPISHSSNLTLFQSHTLPIPHSFRFTLFQSYTQLRIWEEKNCELFPTYFTSLTRHAIHIEVLLLPVIAPVFFLLASNAGQAS